jgi:hypothetical protein
MTKRKREIDSMEGIKICSAIFSFKSVSIVTKKKVKKKKRKKKRERKKRYND